MKYVKLFSQDKHVLEMGGGMTCLAGCMLASSGVTVSCHLTDGNFNSVHNLEMIVDKFTKTQKCDGMKAFQLRWDEDIDQLESSYDVILCADCLFFKESLNSLASSIFTMLRAGGVALIAAPSREGTFDVFKSLAEERFSQVTEMLDYSSEVSKAHEACLAEPGYKPDIHYPKLMVLKK